MIQRYTRPEIEKIWSDENKFDVYLKIEILACEAWCKLGVIPKNDVDKIKKRARFDIDKINEIEKVTKHDVIAFTRSVSESLKNEKQWIHYGLTSSDVVDTANACLIKQANEVIQEDLKKFTDVLRHKAIVYKNTPCIGRTHGIHADITSFGLKWLLWYDEMQRNIERFNQARKNIEVGKLSGAVGNFANNNPEIQTFVCKKLGIGEAKISTQIISRDVYAQYFNALALIGSTIEKIATEIRHLQRTEVGEVEEAFTKGQKGSSAMPHKRNPIVSENMCGCARVLRGYAFASYENNILWHERDISHSSTERIMLPDATNLISYMLKRYGDVLSNLVVNHKQMKKNIDATNGVIFAQRIMNELISLASVSREHAYDLVQPIAMEAHSRRISFKELLLKNKAICNRLSITDIESCFNMDYYFEKIPYIYKKVLG